MAWSGWFLDQAAAALERQRSYPLFIAVEYVEQARRALDWQTPLWLAALPPALWGVAWLWRQVSRRSKQPA